MRHAAGNRAYRTRVKHTKRTDIAIVGGGLAGFMAAVVSTSVSSDEDRLVLHPWHSVRILRLAYR